MFNLNLIEMFVPRHRVERVITWIRVIHSNISIAMEFFVIPIYFAINSDKCPMSALSAGSLSSLDYWLRPPSPRAIRVMQAPIGLLALVTIESLNNVVWLEGSKGVLKGGMPMCYWCQPKSF